MTNQQEQPNTMEPLGPAYEVLQQRLLADGALWRAGLPSTERLEQRLNALARQGQGAKEHHARPAAEASERRSRLRLINETKGDFSVFHGRLRTIAAVATIAAVVALFAVLFYGFAGHGSKTGSSPGTPSASQTTTHSFNTYVAVAPSNPNVLYRLAPANGASNPSLLARSTDGGATWRTFALPTVKGGTATPSVVFVSPLNPQDVFLTVTVTLSSGTPGAQRCPKSVTASGLSSYAALGGGPSYCEVEFLSRDGGAHWGQVHLPASATPAALGDTSGYVYPSVASSLFSNGATVFHVQGNRLYSTTNVDPGNPPTSSEAQSGGTIRIVVSTDGGLDWSYADGALATNTQSICDYAATPSGSTLFAVTSAGCNVEGAPSAFLWRSDDAGAHWAKVEQLPGNVEMGMIAVSRDNGQSPLLYIDMAKETCTISPYISRPNAGSCGFDASPANLQVSADGGKTWTSAPTRGFPTFQGNTLQNPGAPLGVLSDGSVLFLAQQLQGPEGFYTWKLGETSWHQVGPSFNAVSSAFVVSGGRNTACLVTGLQSNFEVHTFSV